MAGERGGGQGCCGLVALRCDCNYSAAMHGPVSCTVVKLIIINMLQSAAPCKYADRRDDCGARTVREDRRGHNYCVLFFVNSFAVKNGFWSQRTPVVVHSSYFLFRLVAVCCVFFCDLTNNNKKSSRDVCCARIARLHG